MGYAESSIKEVTLQSVAEAELVLSTMKDILSRYDFVSVSDLKELVGLPATFRDAKRGWTDISAASITRVDDGTEGLCVLEFPAPVLAVKNIPQLPDDIAMRGAHHSIRRAKTAADLAFNDSLQRDGWVVTSDPDLFINREVVGVLIRRNNDLDAYVTTPPTPE